jgi:hypothetical protein
VIVSQDETIIEFSPAKTALGILGCIAFVAAGVWMLTLDPTQVASGKSFRLFFNSPTFARALGFLAIVIFGGLAIWLAKRILSPNGGIVLNSEGIIDHASSAAAGFIPWDEIRGMSVFEMSGQKMLILHVTDPQKYIEQGSALKRKLNSSNYNMCGSPISFSTKTLKANFDELQYIFERYLQKYCRPGDD